MSQACATLTSAESAALDQLIAAGLAEEGGPAADVTTTALVPADAAGSARLVARASGVIAGLVAAERVFQTVEPRVRWEPHHHDGDAVAPGETLAEVQGPARALLVAERLALNFVGHLSGVASLTRRYVEAVAGTGCRIYDTRKTLPGWRLLQKYAVRVGGGENHRMGLDDAALVKDNHLAAIGSLFAPDSGSASRSGEMLGGIIHRLRKALPPQMPVMIEVETLDHLPMVLTARPDVVLLDNMDTPTLQEAVRMRNRLAPEVLLEASGGITLSNVRAVAESGVDRISIGALTHSAPALDVSMDWLA